MTRKFKGADKKYEGSPAPHFDAFEDVKAKWPAENRWRLIYAGMANVGSKITFANICKTCGVTPFQTEAWWDVIHGQGSWAKN